MARAISSKLSVSSVMSMPFSTRWMLPSMSLSMTMASTEQPIRLAIIPQHSLM